MSHPEEKKPEASAPTPPEVKAEPKKEIDGTGKKIVLVEDDPTTRELLKSLLEKSKFEIKVFDNAQAALNQAKKEPPNLLITDVVLPEMGGYKLFKELQKNDTTKYIPILVISVRKNMQESFLASGADGFISKPIDTAPFLQEVFKLSSMTKKPSVLEGEKKEEEKKK